jgi:polyisoprenoid-binding protein YceI
MSQQTMSSSPAPTTAATGVWRVDPDHSRVGFAVRHLGIATVRGEFTQFDGTLEIGSDGAATRAGGSVAVASIFTHQPMRDEHLRSTDFFDAEQYPSINFGSTRIEPIGDAAFRLTGELTMHGITGEVVLDGVIRGFASDQFGNERVGLEATGEISRADYGISFNLPLAAGGLLIADRVALVLDISAIKQS